MSVLAFIEKIVGKNFSSVTFIENIKVENFSAKADDDTIKKQIIINLKK
jgi:hypothetical protein